MVSNQKKKIDKTVGFYDNFSKKYDRRYSAYLDHTHNRLLKQMNISSGEELLDISCGTGLLAAELLTRFPDIKLSLNDPSKGMLAKAKKRLADVDSVQFTNNSAEEINFNQESFDRVICLNSFHYYADQTRVVQNIYGILKPGGLINVLDWNREGWFQLPDLIISAFSQENINTRSLTEMKTILEENEFEIQVEKRWRFRFWKFFLVEAEK